MSCCTPSSAAAGPRCLSAEGREPRRLCGSRFPASSFDIPGPPSNEADEPTGNLDSRTGQAILNLLRGLNRERTLTVILVTHSTYAATYADRTVELRDGQIVMDVRAPAKPKGAVVSLRS